MRIEYHRVLLADRVRNAAFHAALQRVIVKGKTTVADIGAGTGFLGFLAAGLGAKRVDLYETAEIAAIARKLLRHNRLSNCRIAEVHSTDVAQPDRVDLIVSETLGNYPFEENIIATLNDARERFLNPGGAIIPAAVEQYVCPVVGERQYRDLAAWDEVGYGLDFAPAKAMSLNNIYVRWLERADLLDGGAAAKAWDQVRFDRKNKTTRAGEVEWKATRAATIYGLALWWVADLAEGVRLSTGPLDPRTHWEQLYLPALEPVTLTPGETLRARLKSTTSFDKGTNVTWALAVADAKGKERVRQSMDLEKGFLP
ncbi:MAG TPA: 50S ribosomal protein L11 methyltransferase [Hyphomicrobiaceae bacterium]|nr:50S ribosomal protein L11 methyltransferase [Hyphomicrobiaceae bacterium]